jgi:hypothetical protein
MFNYTPFGGPTPGRPDGCLEIDCPQSVLGLFLLFSFFLSHFFLGLWAPSRSSSGPSRTLLNPSWVYLRKTLCFFLSFLFFFFLSFCLFLSLGPPLGPHGPSQGPFLGPPRGYHGPLLGHSQAPHGRSRVPLGPRPHKKLAGLTPSHRPCFPV